MSVEGQFQSGALRGVLDNVVQQEVSSSKPSSNVTVSTLCWVPSLKLIAALVDEMEKMCEDVLTSICTNFSCGGWGLSTGSLFLNFWGQ